MYIGHKKDDGQTQLLIDHLNGTSLLCEQFAASFGMNEIGKYLGLYHDIGKYSIGFQKRIQEDGPKVDHSTAGAKELFKYIGYFSMCVAGHHSGLMNRGTSISINDGTFEARNKKNLTGNLDYGSYKREIDIKTNTLSLLINPLLPTLQRGPYSTMFMMRMMFSCLVDADYLDTEYFMQNYHSYRSKFESISQLHEKYSRYISGFRPAVGKINKKRCEILDQCLSAGVGKTGLFTLTVPTGGGKTIASLGFALQNAVTNYKKRIIYVIPYTSIIEQTAQVFSNIVGHQNVIEHHMNVDYTDEDGTMDALAEKHKLATENWDAPIIVTTNVQFFESFYSVKTSKCRKLHNVADSVIIFDEAQMLPNDFLLPCVKVIEELVNQYNVTAVLCTATQPSLNKFFDQNVHVKEICSDVHELYQFFKRVNYTYDGEIKMNTLATNITEQSQILCIVNTKKDAQNLFDLIEGEGCYHLSTYLCMKHRRSVIHAIRQRLKENKSCRVIATSLVEAGVDLDFPIVYRELAGLDSIIQAGGRCNREGHYDIDKSITHVFELLKEKPTVPQYIRLPREVTKSIIQKESDISSENAIKEYFDQLHHFKGDSLDKNNILSMHDNNELLFKDIAKKFVLIDDNSKNVFIPLDENSEKIITELKLGIRNRELLRKAAQYSVSVREKEYEILLGCGAIEMLDDNISILVDLNLYDKQKGLVIAQDFGMGVFC